METYSIRPISTMPGLHRGVITSVIS
jgi:hypothetical protein